MTGRELDTATLQTAKSAMKKLAAREVTPLPRAPDPRAEVRAVVRAAGSSFTWGMRILSRRRREAMYAIYAFCREVDDIADGDQPAAKKLEALAGWRQEIDRLYRGEPREPIARALRQPVELYQLPRGEFLAVIDGMEMDARGPIQAPSDEELRLYCRRVAGAVGLLSIRAFGLRGAEAERLALMLGEALQLTNILRDLGEDAARGRFYLPRELLAKHDIVGRDPVSLLADPLLSLVLEEVAQRAEARFAEARALLAKLPRKPLRPAHIMMDIYRRQLELLRARGWQTPTAAPPHLGHVEKLWIVLRNLFG